MAALTSVSNLWPVYSLYNSTFIAPEIVLHNIRIFEKWLYEKFYPMAVGKENMYPVVKLRVSLSCRQLFERYWPIPEKPIKMYREPVIDEQMRVAMERGVKLEDHWKQVGPFWLKRMKTEHPGFCWTKEDLYGPDFINDELYHDWKALPTRDDESFYPSYVRRTMFNRRKRIERQKKSAELENH